MSFSIRNWRPAHLLGAWTAYWAAIVAVKLGPGIAAIARLQAPGAKGSASLGFDNTVLTARVLQGNTTVWLASADLATIAAWVVGPPLVLWGAWMLTRQSRRDQATFARTAGIGAPALGAGSVEPIAHSPAGDEPVVARRTTPDPARTAPPKR